MSTRKVIREVRAQVDDLAEQCGIGMWGDYGEVMLPVDDLLLHLLGRCWPNVGFNALPAATVLDMLDRLADAAEEEE
jgi:hypothetical protein